jgi:hypothetical protein
MNDVSFEFEFRSDSHGARFLGFKVNRGGSVNNFYFLRALEALAGQVDTLIGEYRKLAGSSGSPETTPPLSRPDDSVTGAGLSWSDIRQGQPLKNYLGEVVGFVTEVDGLRFRMRPVKASGDFHPTSRLYDAEVRVYGYAFPERRAAKPLLGEEFVTPNGDRVGTVAWVDERDKRCGVLVYADMAQ